jgi:hypothetical protein
MRYEISNARSEFVNGAWRAVAMVSYFDGDEKTREGEHRLPVGEELSSGQVTALFDAQLSQLFPQAN